MKKQLLIAGMLLASTSARADDKVPDVCLALANYAAQTLDLSFSDGSVADKENPKNVRLHRDFVKFPITQEKYLGSCDDDPAANLKPRWCERGGGSPSVYQIEVSNAETPATPYPVASVVVTFSRGSCRIDEVEAL